MSSRLLKISFISALIIVSCSIAPALGYAREAVVQQSDSQKELAEAAKISAEVTTLYSQGKYDEALAQAKRVLKIREKLLSPNDPLLADSYNNLAMVLLAKQNFDDAEGPLKKSLVIYEKAAETNALLLAKTLDNLALIRFVKNDPAKAEILYLRAVSLKEQKLGADHDETIYSLNNLTEFYRRQKQYGKASSTLQRVIAAKGKQLGDDHFEVGKLLEKQACLLYANDQKAEAEKVEARANHILYEEAATKGQTVFLSNEAFLCKLITNPHPDVFSIMRGRRNAGSVKLAVEVETDETGKVVAARFIGFDMAFKGVTEKAAFGAKLRPTIVDGHPIKVKGVITHDFTTMTRTVLVPVMVPGLP